MRKRLWCFIGYHRFIRLWEDNDRRCDMCVFCMKERLWRRN